VCPLLLVLAAWLGLLLPGGSSASPIQGLPLMRHYAAAELPAAPRYSNSVVDAEGTLYTGSSEGVMVLRSGIWSLFELPRKAGVYALLSASDGRLYVGGTGVFGELRRDPEGRLRFVDLLPRLAGADGAPPEGEFYALVENTRGVHVRNLSELFLLGHDGRTHRQPLPQGLGHRLFAAGDALYGHVEGLGLCRIGEGAPVPLRGGERLSRTPIVDVRAHADGLLIVAADGFHLATADGLRRLAGDADAGGTFAAHPPYTSLWLADGSLVLGSDDGTLLRFAPDLRLVQAFAPTRGAIVGLAVDHEGGLWVTGEDALMRLRLPSPWTMYGPRHGLESQVFDSAWYAGRLWVAGAGVARAEATDASAPRFEPLPWSDGGPEAFALEATASGLLVGERRGLRVLDPGQQEPRWLLGPRLYGGVRWLWRSEFDPARVLALGNGQAAWLGLRDGRWQVIASWEPHVGEFAGLYQAGPDQLWIGDARGGVHRWDFDPASGGLRERHRVGSAEGLLTDPELGTRLVRLGGELFAISGTTVQRFEGGRFVAASLPALPGLERPWELQATETGIGGFAWTSRQLWRREAGDGDFRLLHVSPSRVPGYMGVELQDDGRLRIAARAALLQFAPEFADPAPPPLQARLDRIGVQAPGHALSALPLLPGPVRVLPPGSGLGLRLGLGTMEPDLEFRYRLLGYRDAWSGWNADRALAYRRLPPGDYVFELEARIAGGRQAEPLRYPLRVEPFWYERGLVRVLFGGAGLLALVGGVWLRIRRMRARNRELERRIAERTAELEAANRRLTELAVVDGLTGIANRHALDRALERDWKRCHARGEPLAVVMCDVDRFKEFNDAHGHLVGDEQLCRIAQALQAEMAGVDEIAARYGGEEFVLVLPGVGLEQALARAERVRWRVEQATADAGLPGSVSLGVAAQVPAADEDPAVLVQRADRALYRAKRAGRNRVEAVGGEQDGTAGGSADRC